MYEDSVETVGPSTELSIHIRHTHKQPFTSQYQSVARRWTLLLKCQVIGIIRYLDKTEKSNIREFLKTWVVM